MFELNTPTSIRGYVTDSALLSPENSMWTNDRDQYSVTILLEDCSQFNELQDLYKENEHNALPHEGDWVNKGGAYWVTFKSLIEPRINWPSNLKQSKELKQGHLVSIDFRPVLKVLEGAAYETLVIISVDADPYDQTIEWEESAETIAAEEKYGDLNF